MTEGGEYMIKLEEVRNRRQEGGREGDETLLRKNKEDVKETKGWDEERERERTLRIKGR